ncbi:MAG: hypothetical protein EZS28_018824 [Streblomastix strix]|uniref:Uncharacterized protein n=1 Tax=Streblomastix strix TaxID=222440 RepID=A0A5J4VST6_9EUKA|nr:MAG: hypothetical protein EZS28_018824 [Streblomastix strix]
MHNLSLSHETYGYDDPNSHIHSDDNSAFDVQQEGQTYQLWDHPSSDMDNFEYASAYVRTKYHFILQCSKDRIHYSAGTSITDASFLTIPEDEIEQLKTSQPPNSTEQKLFKAQILHSVISILQRTSPRKKSTNLHKYGVVGTDCIPITVVPTRTDICTQPGGKYEKFLVGYREAQFFSGNSDIFKEALIKVGSIRSNSNMIIGWKNNKWIIAKQESDLVYAQFGEDYEPGIEICTGKNKPSSECVCPEVASGSYTKTKCEQDKAVIIVGSSGSMRIGLQMIVAVMSMPITNEYFDAIADYAGVEGDANYIPVMKDDQVRFIEKNKEWLTVEKDEDIGKNKHSRMHQKQRNKKRFKISVS